MQKLNKHSADINFHQNFFNNFHLNIEIFTLKQFFHDRSFILKKNIMLFS